VREREPGAGARRRRSKVGPFVALALLALLAILGNDRLALDANAAVSRWVSATLPGDVADPLTASLVLGSTSVSVALAAALAALLYVCGRRLAALSLGLLLVGIAVELLLKSQLGHPGVWPELHRQTRWYPLPEVSADSGLGEALALRSPFPSGHVLRLTFLALAASGLAAGRLRSSLARLARVAAWLLALCGVASVVYLGWHWATDALGGLALGYALAAAASYLQGPGANGAAQDERDRRRGRDGDSVVAT